jgi:hypothetical protein
MMAHVEMLPRVQVLGVSQRSAQHQGTEHLTVCRQAPSCVWSLGQRPVRNKPPPQILRFVSPPHTHNLATPTVYTEPTAVDLQAGRGCARMLAPVDMLQGDQILGAADDSPQPQRSEHLTGCRQAPLDV